jgi:monoamine oxidase
MQRRDFLEMVGRVGGAAALHHSMEAMGFLAVPTNTVFSLRGRMEGRKVLILGAGLAGMTVAHELGKLGYDCRVIEARSRPGGRCHTARAGVTEKDVDGVETRCTFDEGHYFNPGPMRIPYHHRVTLDYCREFGVPLEVFNNANEAGYYYAENIPGEPPVPLAGKRIRTREARADLYGYTAELLAKAINEHELDARVTAEDREKFIEFLRSFGRLGKDFIYKGSETRGYAIERGAGNRPGAVGDPFGLHDLVYSGLGARISGERMFDMQMTMFQPVGGMDRIATSMAHSLGSRITYNAEVKEIRRNGNGVRVVYSERGHMKEARAELCVCTLPLAVLARIPADFSPEMAKSIAAIPYGETGKIGLQFNRRFWEEDDQIFGGGSSTNLPISQIVYPSYGFLGKKGVLIGSYVFGKRAKEFGTLTHQQRVDRALADGAKIHPQYPRHYENGFSLAWHKSPYNLGGWASYTDELRKTHYAQLNQPDGPIHLAGEHLSYLTAWMAGAFDSGRSVATAVHTRMMQNSSIELQGAV